MNSQQHRAGLIVVGVQLLLVSSAQRAGQLAAEIVANRLRAFPQLALALPTGRTPKLMYQHLRALNASQQLPSRQATLVQLDEYLGPDRGAMRTELLGAVGEIPWRQKILWDQPERPRPDLGLAVLGLGGNGHVAFVEPGYQQHRGDIQQLPLSPETAAANDAVEQEVITVNIPYLRRSRELILLVTGAAKSDVLAQLLALHTSPASAAAPAGAEQDALSANLPAAELLDHPRLTIIADQQAASKLAASQRKRTGRALVAIGCRGADGHYSSASRGRTLRAARLALAQDADLLLLSGGVLGAVAPGESEAGRMAAELPTRIDDLPVLLEEASDRSAQHQFLVAPLLTAAEINEITVVTSWWHLPRLRLIYRHGVPRFAAAWDLRGMAGQRRLRTEVAGMFWAPADYWQARRSWQQLLMTETTPQEHPQSIVANSAE